MRNKRIIIPILLVLVVLMTSCAGKDQKVSESELSSMEVLEPVIQSVDSLNIMIDPRIELLSAVQLISGYEHLTQLQFPYTKRMGEYFKAYEGHAAVKKFQDLSKRGFSYDAPPAVMLYLSNPIALQQRLPFTDYLKGRAGGERNLKDFLQKLGDFGRESAFEDFYRDHLPYYQEIVDGVYNDIKDFNLTKALDDYYGMEINSYNIILAPLSLSGGYGPRVQGENGLYDVYGIIGPKKVMSVEGSLQQYPDFSVDTIQYLVWHEFSHSFVNPTTEKFSKEIQQYKKLYKPIESHMKRQAYSDWEISVNEHIIRAITTRLSYIHLGKEVGDQVLAYERSQGFYYIDLLVESLEQYEMNRGDYPNFESYYPELIKVFKSLSEQELPESFFQSDFEGPINHAFLNKDSEKIVVIIPTNESDKQVEKEIADYAEMIRKNLFPRENWLKMLKPLTEILRII